MNNITWHCSIVIQNDTDCNDDVQCLTSHVMNRTYHDYQGRPYSDQRKAQIYVLSEFIRNYVEEITDAGAEYKGYNPMTCELICGAIQTISFREIAEDLIADYTPKSPAEIADNEEYFNIRFGNYDIDED